MQYTHDEKEPTFKELLGELYGQDVTEQEAFNAQDDLAELLLVLDEIDRELFPQDEVAQGGVK